MTRYGPPALAAGIVAIALLAFVVAMRLDDPLPAPLPTATARVVTMRPHGTAVPSATATATATSRPLPSPTELPDCTFWTQQGTVCAWPTPTQVLPIPECGTPDAGQRCKREGPILATVEGLPTSTPTETFGDSTDGRSETR